MDKTIIQPPEVKPQYPTCSFCGVTGPGVNESEYQTDIYTGLRERTYPPLCEDVKACRERREERKANV